MRVIRPGTESQAPSLRFEVVPAYDLVISLAAAANPERHELAASWARQVREALPPPLRRDLTFFFADPLALGAGPIQMVPELPNVELATFLSAIESMDAADFAAALLG